jgi:transposase
MRAAKYFAKGKGASEVAKLLGVRRQSAHAWRQAWHKAGVKGLASKGAAGPKARLGAEQKATLMKAIIEGPKAHGHPTEVWTLPRVAKLIEEQTGEHYHSGHVWWILRELGLSCQQPTRRAIERNETAIAEWTSEGWPKLKKKRGARSAPSSSSTKAG